MSAEKTVTVSVDLSDDEQKALRHETTEPHGHDIRIGVFEKLRNALDSYPQETEELNPVVVVSGVRVRTRITKDPPIGDLVDGALGSLRIRRTDYVTWTLRRLDGSVVPLGVAAGVGIAPDETLFLDPDKAGGASPSPETEGPGLTSETKWWMLRLADRLEARSTAEGWAAGEPMADHNRLRQLADHHSTEDREPTEDEWCCDSCGVIAESDAPGWEQTPQDHAGVTVERCPACRLTPQPDPIQELGRRLLSDEAVDVAARWPHEQEVPGVWTDDDSWEFEDGHDPRDQIRADARGQLKAALAVAVNRGESSCHRRIHQEEKDEATRHSIEETFTADEVRKRMLSVDARKAAASCNSTGRVYPSTGAIKAALDVAFPLPDPEEGK